jgi:hypothetical protein
MSFLLALTPTSLYVLTVKQGWTGVKVKKQLGVLPRDGLRVWMDDGKVVKRFRVEATDGSAIAFEMNRGKWTSRFAADLEQALASAPAGSAGATAPTRTPAPAPPTHP